MIKYHKRGINTSAMSRINMKKLLGNRKRKKRNRDKLRMKMKTKRNNMLLKM